MAETGQSVRLPLHMSVYADTHAIFRLLQSMVSSLVIAQPDDPILYLIRLLQRSSVDIPRIMLLGPPAVGKHTVARKLCAELGALHVTKDSLLKGQSELSRQAHRYTLKQQELPDALLVCLIQERLNEFDCFNRGWVLDGIPQTRLQALSLQEAGIIPEHVVMLQAPDNVLLQRSEGKMVDPLTGDVYNQTFIWQIDDVISQRLEKGLVMSEKQHRAELQRFNCEVTGLMSAYQHVLKVISTDQPHTDIYQQVLAFVQTRHCYRTPRILLLGPPGSGKSHQARLLSEKYKMVDVCCDQLLRSAAAAAAADDDDSALGEMIQSYLSDGRPAPHVLLLQLLDKRLSQVDCSCRGWVLHGFPRDLQGARLLHESQQQPNRVFFLELTDDICLERLTLRATDPVSGQRFHTVTRPALSSQVQSRLQTRPEDNTHTVTHNLSLYRTHTAALQFVYSDAVHVDADQDPLSVFEALESRLNTV